jgi:hypothetical protein
MSKTKSRQTTTKDKAPTPPVDKIQAAAQLLMEDRIKREQAFTQEYSELVEQLCKKHGCKLSISQPQLIIQAL